MIGRNALDRGTIDQASLVLDEIGRRLDAIALDRETRDRNVNTLPTAAFVAFVCTGLLAGKTQADFAQWIPAGFKVIDTAVASRGENLRRHYGRGRRCALATREIIRKVMDEARTAVETAKVEGEARFAIDRVMARKLALETLVYRHLLEFCAVMRMLDPLPEGAREMMANAGGLCEEVFASGWAERNVVKIR